MPTQSPPVSKGLRARFSRTTLFFAGIGLFDVLIWTAAALAN